MSKPLETDIWARVIQPGRGDLEPEMAKAILRFKFRKPDKDRINELIELSRQGSLNGEAKRELDRYLHVGHVLTLMHSKARVALRSSDGRQRKVS